MSKSFTKARRAKAPSRPAPSGLRLPRILAGNDGISGTRTRPVRWGAAPPPAQSVEFNAASWVAFANQMSPSFEWRANVSTSGREMTLSARRQYLGETQVSSWRGTEAASITDVMIHILADFNRPERNMDRRPARQHSRGGAVDMATPTGLNDWLTDAAIRTQREQDEAERRFRESLRAQLGDTPVPTVSQAAQMAEAIRIQEAAVREQREQQAREQARMWANVATAYPRVQYTNTANTYTWTMGTN